ncbi:MAG: DUF86 domain-containing protein [Desulfovibrio sp.]|jgi:uncharacterized protein with HEPN domain|nr:DUF86 domain-containing protein [Desulfovibrio sp.]
MLEYAKNLRDYSERCDRDSFLNDALLQNAAGMCFINLGEFQNRLPEEFKLQQSGIPWAKIRGLRNIMAHDYVSVDWNLIWEVMQDGIPQLINDYE